MVYRYTIYLLIISCCFSSYAEEKIWRWAEIDLRTSTLTSYGNAINNNLNASRNFELYVSESERAYLLLCDFSTSYPSCMDQNETRYESFFHVSKGENSKIDLSTGVILGSVQTYVLFQGTRMITISLQHSTQ